MGTKLITRSAFARLAKVTPTSVTEACKGRLGAACTGKNIDPEHPEAVAYIRANDPLQTKKQPPIAKGIDALYHEAVEYANKIGRLSSTSIQLHFSIGYERARKIKNLIDAAGAFTPDEPEPEAGAPIVVTPSMIEQAQRLLDGKVRLGGEIFRDRVEARSTESSMLVPEETGDELPGLSDFDETGVESLADWTLRAVVLKYGTHERFKGWLQAYKSIVDIGAKEISNAEKRGQLIPRDFVKSHILSHYDRAHINLMTDAAQTIARRIVGDIQAGATVEDCEVFVSEQISRHIQEAKASIARALSSV